MHARSLKLLGALVGVISAVSTASALPKLQLDISGAIYAQTSESVITTQNEFTLWALAANSLTPTNPFYLSIAVLKPDGMTTSEFQASGADLGSLVFNGTTIDVTADMLWGSPRNMPPHGVFPTWYYQYEFNLVGASKFTNYNVETVARPHVGPVVNASGNARFKAFEVDTSGLHDGATVVFDLYTYGPDGIEGAGRILKAPFSHNAEGNYIPSVPENQSLVIALGVALLSMLAARLRLSAS